MHCILLILFIMIRTSSFVYQVLKLLSFMYRTSCDVHCHVFVLPFLRVCVVLRLNDYFSSALSCGNIIFCYCCVFAKEIVAYKRGLVSIITENKAENVHEDYCLLGCDVM
jgi:hypothetical protein